MDIQTYSKKTKCNRCLRKLTVASISVKKRLVAIYFSQKLKKTKMKNQVKHIALAAIIALSTSEAFAGLDWTNGALSNPDNLYRSSKAVAYSTSGNVFVTGVEENVTGNKLIVTKKFSSTGSLLNSITNSYAILPGTVVYDYPVSVTLDGAGNVYVLGSQYATSSRANDIVVIKYNSQLVQQWKKLIYNANSSQQNFDDKPCKLLVDVSNNVYVAGTWGQVSFFGNEEIVVRKFDPSGTILYTETVPQATGTTIDDANDMCIDNSLNITVCAKTTTNSILYARIDNTGSLAWKKFYMPTHSYSLYGTPQIECTTSGTLYLASSLDRESPVNYHHARHMLAKLNSAGTKLWESLSPELSQRADAVVMRLDANNNIYTGSDFIGGFASEYQNHRLYKFNSSGTLLWSHTSPETSRFFKFEIFANTAVFILTETTSPITPVLRKLDASDGNIIWTEIITVAPPPVYYHLSWPPQAIAVNSVTSEVAYCGNIHAIFLNPTAEEYRWLVKKYGATSPRMAFEETSIENNISEFTVSVFPNPANNELTVSSEQLVAGDEIKIMDVNGKIVKQILIANNCMQQKISIAELPDGIYFVVNSNERTETKKISIHH